MYLHSFWRSSTVQFWTGSLLIATTTGIGIYTKNHLCRFGVCMYTHSHTHTVCVQPFYFFIHASTTHGMTPLEMKLCKARYIYIAPAIISYNEQQSGWWHFRVDRFQHCVNAGFYILPGFDKLFLPVMLVWRGQGVEFLFVIYREFLNEWQQLPSDLSQQYTYVWKVTHVQM